MAEADPAPTLRVAAGTGGDLILRIASAAVLVPLALAFAYLGGAPFAVFWGIAAVVVVWEWTLLVVGDRRRTILVVAVVTVMLTTALAASAADVADTLRTTRLAAALIVLAIGMVAAAALAPPGRGAWMAIGMPYAGAVAIAPIVLRADTDLGLVAMLYLFAVVWATDIAAYFAGRAIGGPKLAPRLSPKKTWSGSLGGIVGAVAAGTLVVAFGDIGYIGAAAVVAIMLCVVAQVGDLFESSLKRRFGAKDSGFLIPGHGGLMDRLDGFVAAAVLAGIIGLARGGIDAPAWGLLVW